MSENTQKLFEVSFLSKTEDGVAMLIGHIKSAGGEIVHEGSIREIKLAYPIKKETSAYFGCIKCNLPKEAIDEISKTLNFEKDILRFLIVTPLAKTQEKNQSRYSHSQTPQRKTTSQEKTAPIREKKQSQDISNELLEEKLEEILK